jgi:phosphonate transport system substrate-binding protein
MLIYVILLMAFHISPSWASEEKLLVFGRVQDNPVRAIKDRQEFVDYIAKKLAPLGYTGGRVLVLDKVRDLAQAVNERKVDLYHDSVAAAVVLAKKSNSMPIARQWKYNEAEYYSVIVVRKDSGVETLSGLKGKVIAFDEQHSTSAHILPRMMFVENKIKLAPVVLPAKPDRDSVGFIHGSDDNALNLLVTGKVDAAATSHREFQNLRAEIRDGVKVVAKSIAVPRQIIAVRSDLDPKVVTALKDLLINMEKTPEGQGVLTRQQGTTNIDAIPQSSLERMKEVEKFLFATLGKQVDSW